MKKIKKILAMVMAMAMIMGLGMTANAADEFGTAEIKVTNLATKGTNTVTYYKILTPDVTKDSGYKIVDGVTITGFDSAETFLKATVAEQKAALAENNLGVPQNGGGVVGTTWSATVEPGYYAVYVKSDADIVYTNPMIVSVQYDKATEKEDGSGYVYSLPAKQKNNEVVAKYTSFPVEKEGKDAEDDVVEIGQTATYTINTFMPAGDNVKTFVLTDTLTGAEYIKNSVKVKIGESSLEDLTNIVSYNDAGNMVITLTNYLEGNAGKEVVITYDVTVKAIKVDNNIVATDGDHKFGEATEHLYTGSIKLTKYKDAGVTPMAGAKFVVFKTAGDKTLYAVVDETNNIQSWTENKENATRLTTDEDGVIQVNGLNLGIYGFEEVEAPDGFTINTDKPKVEVKRENTTAEAKLTPVATSLNDTNIIGLPSTGGIGTTLFTIGGIVIMVAAAALFFANRKKSDK